MLRRGVQSISDLINVPGFINLDFADITSVMANSGYAHMGVGSASGKDKAEVAAKMAISSPLLETSIGGASGVVISIVASPDVGLEDVDVASTMISNECNPDANVIWGVVFDSELEDEMRITIVATGFEKKPGDEMRTVSPLAVKKDKAEKKEEKPAVVATPVAPKTEAAPAAPVVEAPVAEAPKAKKSDDVFDLDDFFGDMFGKK